MANQNWAELARIVIARGAPILGAALGGPLGGAAGQILADALGADGGDAAQVRDALGREAEAAQAPVIAQAEQRWIELLRSEAVAAQLAITQTHETIREEMRSADLLQRWWRPIYALELTAECALVWACVVHGFWRGDTSVFNALAAGTGLAIAYWGFRFGVLGIYVGGRTREKLAGAEGFIRNSPVLRPGPGKKAS